MLFREAMHALDTECHGTLTAFLDMIDKDGVSPEDGRAFAVWLYEQIAAHNETAQALRDLERIRADQDEAPTVDVEPEVFADQLYLPNEPVARTRATRLAQDPRVREALVQFEPNNGWVVVLFPNFADLREYAGEAEIKDGIARPVKGKTPIAPAHKLVEGATRAGDGGQDGKAIVAPSKGSTAKVWTIADAAVAQSGAVDRGAIIAACVEQGINKATAATQYSKWRKARGHV